MAVITDSDDSLLSWPPSPVQTLESDSSHAARAGATRAAPGVGYRKARPTLKLRRHHLPALDGLRAVAVCAVIAYHLQFSWARGGYLGVDVFFVLSGFLITSLLTEEVAANSRISLSAFWIRRARRLLPALVLVLGAIVLFSAVGNSALNKSTLPGDVWSTLFYFANWHFIAGHNSYFAQFLVPSPLEHAWSLAIEEQFYVLWPLIVALLVRVGRGAWRRVAMGATVALVLFSVADMALITRGGGDLTRGYFGTDSRAFELMIGALLALWLGNARSVIAPKRWYPPGGWLALAGLLTCFGFLGGPPRWMFDGGFLGVSILTAIILANIALEESGVLGSVLSVQPLRWIGRISYGLYLWHWPVFVLLSTATTGLSSWQVDVLRIVITLAAATASFYLVEEPIRRGGFSGLRIKMAAVPVTASLVGVTAMSLLTGPGVAASASPLPGAEPTGQPVFSLASVPTAQKRLRVLLIGDSEMVFAAPAIEAALDATGVITTSSDAYPGWGLTTDHTWRRDLGVAVARYRPDVVLGTWSWDKVEAATHPAAYARLLDQLMKWLQAPRQNVKGVVLLQFPVVGLASGVPSMGKSEVNRELSRWNAAAHAEAERNPSWIGYLPVAGSLELGGAYSTWLPDASGHWVRARTIDEFHLCPAGAARYGDAVLTDLEAWWRLPKPSARWWKGAWTKWPSYQSHGKCPNDSPGGA